MITGIVASYRPTPGSGDVLFSPPQAASLTYWLSAGTGVTEAGSGVSTWENLGTGADVVQTTDANRPTLGTGGLEGRPYIQCNGVDQWFEDLPLTQPSGLTNSSPRTVFVVTDAIAGLGGFPAVLGSTFTNGGKVGLYFRPTVNEQIQHATSSARAGNVTNPQIITGILGRGFTATGAGRSMFRQNGVNVDQGSSYSPSSAVGATQFLRSTGIGGGGFYNGHIYEVLIYEAVLNTTDVDTVEAYLANKYGITLT